MAPPTATVTETAAHTGVIKMNTDVEDEELKFEVDSLSRGPNQLQGIPKFPSFHEHRKHIVIHMAAVFRNWARVGFTEGISGHISVRDPEYDGLIWMNPIGRHFALLNGSDMMCLRISDGAVVGGNRTRPYNAPGYYIHSEIHKARSNIHAICHAHTIAGRAWAAFGKPLDMIQQDICDLYGVLAVDDEYAGIVTAEQEGQNIARALGQKGKAAILLNHGLISVGETVDEASFLLGLLDRSCDIQLRVEAACGGNEELRKSVIPRELAVNNFRMAGEKNWLYEEAQPDIEYEIEMAGGVGGVIGSGLEEMRVDVDG
ncbi:class II aldolase/adducin domain-containing protein [Pochonia chlamydosporia 170]|uniref:Class II aldolase/adducin domain-containing protein n=1 Tax=Pochonia chlamydosporia 170 TaxID=1380566 RepID=A0A179FRQ7_METCM|nr:class II aldolase/adducin domain-containing protein [Pochonia chlamydosporia 170]OAQ67880.1 class II aldolase/adducin domain-containing protein [Pochonia chlamydosporia 170]